MHIHRLEKIWLTFGMTMLVVFLTVLGISTFAFGMDPPSHIERIDPAKVNETAPFDQPGLKDLGGGEYEAVLIAYAFSYDPNKIEVPAGSKVTFKLTSPDVVHGFAIPGTNVNAMVLPGEITTVTHTFDKPGEYLVLCNEYCGTGHEFMMMKIIVS